MKEIEKKTFLITSLESAYCTFFIKINFLCWTIHSQQDLSMHYKQMEIMRLTMDRILNLWFNLLSINSGSHPSLC